MAQDIPIRDQTIDLDQFLKLSGAVDSGGQAKFVIQSGLIKVNGQVETRRRCTLKIGDIVSVQDANEYRVTARPPG